MDRVVRGRLAVSWRIGRICAGLNRMHSLEINGQEQTQGQPNDAGSRGKNGQ